MINLEPDPTPPAQPDLHENRTDEFVEEKLDTPRDSRPWQLTYYRSHFDVQTAVVLQRLKKAFYPLAAGDFFEGGSPDLYTPLWTCFTLVLLFTAGGNMVQYEEEIDQINWVDSISKVTAALLLFFGLLFAVPLAARVLMAREDSKPGLVELISLYGYSFAVYLPVTVVCLFPVGWARWLLLAVAGTWSGLLMFKNYRREFEGIGGWKRWVLVGMVICGHVVVLVAGNLYFFR